MEHAQHAPRLWSFRDANAEAPAEGVRVVDFQAVADPVKELSPLIKSDHSFATGSADDNRVGKEAVAQLLNDFVTVPACRSPLEIPGCLTLKQLDIVGSVRVHDGTARLAGNCASAGKLS
jgi:hypothetical protein